jgi:phosphatidylserine/phosphatidylglycerophosphate/cardiolipin synthase-like enzyme
MQSLRCIVCKVEITQKEHDYSLNFYKMPLCRDHQKIQKIAIARQTEAEKEVNSKQSETKTIPQVPTVKINNSLIQWVSQWVSDKPINISTDSKQFFISGMELEELARDVIGKAKDEILVTSPYVDSCHLATALQRAVERRVKVKVIARRPTNTKNDALKGECQANLRKEGVVLHYNNSIHSKIIIIDRQITIISSMNLYSGSTGGATLEAGIVSFDKNVVDSATKYVLELLERPESSDSTSTATSYWKPRRY